MPSTETHSSTAPLPCATDDWSLSTFLRDSRSHFPGYLWEPFLPKQSVVMLAADAFSGKSMFCLGLGLALAAGNAFLESPARQANVLYIGLDSPRWDYGTQIRKLLGGREPPSGFHFLPEPFRSPNPEWRARVGAYVLAHEIQLVILDTLRATHDKQENDSGDMQAVLSELRAIGADCGIAVLFLHHCPKPRVDGNRSNYRGSTVIKDSSDVFISMSAKRVGPNASILTLKCEKGRGVRQPDSLVVNLTWDEDAHTASLVRATQAIPLPTCSLEGAVDARLAGGPSTIKELVALVPSDGLARKTIRNKVDAYLKLKRTAGLVEAERSARQYVWHLTREVGKDAA